MAPPRSKRSRQGSSSMGPTDSQIAQWLYDATAIERWNKMKESRIFEGSFMVYPDFAAYGLQELARRSGLESLLDYNLNKHKINHVMVKLFYANLNLGHQQPRSREDCVWSLVCSQQVFFSLDRMAHILQSPSMGINIIDVDCAVGRRDRVSHLFMGDDMTQLRSKFLRPKACILHKTLMRSILPRSGSYEQIYPENFQALYAIWGGIQVNWT